MIGAVLALGALGDVLLELHGFTIGGGGVHGRAICWQAISVARHRRIAAANWIAPPVAAAVAVLAWYLFGTLPNRSCSVSMCSVSR